MYSSGQNQFLLFCKEFNVNKVLPVSQELLCYFVSHLGKRGLAVGTIKSYLAAVRNLQIGYGYPSPFDTSMPQLDMIMRGIKITQGKQGRTPKQKLPITPKILRQIRESWAHIDWDYDMTMLWAAAVTCFFGFMRAGELMVSRKGEFDASQHLTLGDVATDCKTNPSFIQLTLKASKTDPFRKGVEIVLGGTQDELCPVRAMFSYLRMRGEGEGALFRRQDGLPLTKPYFVRRIRESLATVGYDEKLFSGHSFRAGAATTAAARKIEDSVIKTLGRWESAAYLLYVRIPKEELKGVAQELAKFGKAEHPK